MRFELTVGYPTPHFKCGALDQLCHSSVLLFQPALLQVVFLKMTIWANELKVAQVIVAPVSVFVMHLKNLFFSIPAPFAHVSPRFQKASLELAMTFYFVMRAAEFVQNTCSVCIRTCAATRFLMFTCQNRGPADHTGRLLPGTETITYLAAKYSPSTHLGWASVDRLVADAAGCVCVPRILSHSASIP